ncbi:MAG: phosphate signaling complex protein PhoU [Ruminococcaceae bacterium]|nr:phosphate signaling complex protein PhoU [Oscillospiraceae bacterium]
MRTRFDQQLELLNQELTQMGALCEYAISVAAKAFLDNDKSLLPAVFTADSEIDQKERDIEALCLKLLLRQQPVAKDLRSISSAMKMISDMERIGDQAADIAEITRHLDELDIKSRIHIGDMARSTIKMVTDSVAAFVRKDLVAARAVMEYDDVVDELFDKVKSELVELLREDSSVSSLCLDMLMIAKYFERIGDHATNIAEWVEFSITGEHFG